MLFRDATTYKSLTSCVRKLRTGRCVVSNMNTTFSKLRYLRIAGLAAGAVAVAGAAVLVTASAAGLNAGPRPSSPRQAVEAASIGEKATPAEICDAFVTHLTSDLGKGLTKAQVNAAIQKAI